MITILTKHRYYTILEVNIYVTLKSTLRIMTCTTRSKFKVTIILREFIDTLTVKILNIKLNTKGGGGLKLNMLLIKGRLKH